MENKKPKSGSLKYKERQEAERQESAYYRCYNTTTTMHPYQCPVLQQISKKQYSR